MTCDISAYLKVSDAETPLMRRELIPYEDSEVAFTLARSMEPLSQNETVETSRKIIYLSTTFCPDVCPRDEVAMRFAWRLTTAC
jgi:hypothetical protein